MARDGVLSTQEAGKPLERKVPRPQLPVKRHIPFPRCWAPPSLVSHLWTPQGRSNLFPSWKWGLLQGAVPAMGYLGADESLGMPVAPRQCLLQHSHLALHPSLCVGRLTPAGFQLPILGQH